MRNTMRSTSYQVRRARLDEASILTEVALRSKAHWGYSAEFMAAARAEMSVTPEQLRADTTFVLDVLEESGSDQIDKVEMAIVRGFYKLRQITPQAVELTDLFLDPLAIGLGWGRALWEHAVATARGMGYLYMTWESDPNAEGFYLRMGAQRVGEVESTVKPGRKLPRMSYRLADEGQAS
jgi:GNAT superfamily N-acetyltransferase